MTTDLELTKFAVSHVSAAIEWKSLNGTSARIDLDSIVREVRENCGMPSWIDPSDQSPPPDYCHEIDHGTAEDRAVFGHHSAEP